MHGSNIRIIKNKRETALEAYKSCFMQGTARKNSLYKLRVRDLLRERNEPRRL